jgi:hypothetical protein
MKVIDNSMTAIIFVDMQITNLFHVESYRIQKLQIVYFVSAVGALTKAPEYL